MRASFPDAMVTDFEAMIPSMTNNPKDRHVLAAAIRGGAAVILREQIADYCKPAVTIADFLSMLDKTAPNFAAEMGRFLPGANPRDAFLVSGVRPTRP